MSVTEFVYQYASHDDLLAVIRWAQNNLCLRDWSIVLDTGPQIPRELMPDKPTEYAGLASIDFPRLRALVWVPLDRLRADNYNPIAVCLHEMTHIAQESRGIDKDELFTNIIDPILYRLYCMEKKIKMADMK